MDAIKVGGTDKESTAKSANDDKNAQDTKNRTIGHYIVGKKFLMVVKACRQDFGRGHFRKSQIGNSYTHWGKGRHQNSRERQDLGQGRY